MLSTVRFLPSKFFVYISITLSFMYLHETFDLQMLKFIPTKEEVSLLNEAVESSKSVRVLAAGRSFSARNE